VALPQVVQEVSAGLPEIDTLRFGPIAKSHEGREKAFIHWLVGAAKVGTAVTAGNLFRYFVHRPARILDR
jgi:hypothetical protein